MATRRRARSDTPKRPAPPSSGANREEKLRAALDDVRARCDLEARRNSDPVEFVHRYRAPADQELVALLASAMAFGNVKALRAKIEDALGRIGPDVARAADDPTELAARLRGWKHRVYRDDDLVRLLTGARRVQRAAGSLGAALAREIERAGELRPALSAWVAAIRRAGGLDQTGGYGEAGGGGAGFVPEVRGNATGAPPEPPHRQERRGGAHILADPGKGSAVKRLMLLLRWMARPADGVDLGLWPIPPSMLLVPVDTHIHKLSNNLDLTRRKDVSWRTAEEITAALRRFDPADPVKYDFSLCHLGMLQRCPSRRDPVRCEGCGIQTVCRHWPDRSVSDPTERVGHLSMLKGVGTSPTR